MAPSLTVWRYETPLGALAGEVRLKDLQQRGALKVHDAITITWVPGATRPRVAPMRHSTAAAAGKGSVLGALVGMVVLTPAAGAAAGATVAAVARRVKGTGIDQALLQEVKEALQPGTSVLLVLASDTDIDTIRPFLDRRDSTLIHAVLAPDAPEALRELLGIEEPEP